MGWYEELLADEERKRQEAAGGEPAAGATLPELIKQGIDYMQNVVGPGVRERMGRDTGVPPVPPNRAIIPGISMDPYTAMQLEQYYPGMNIPTEPVPAERPTSPDITPQTTGQYKTGQEWQRFVQAGGTKRTVQYADGTKVTEKKGESDAEKQQRKIQEQRQGGNANLTQGSAYGQYPSGPMNAVEPGTPGVTPPGMTPGGGYMSPEDKARAAAEQIKYASRIKPEETMSPEEYATKQREIADAKKAKAMELLRKAYPERGAVLKEAYDRIGKMSKFTRIGLSLLNANPWWTDVQAGVEADYIEKRAEAMALKEMGIETARFDAEKVIMEGLKNGQDAKLKKVASELSARLDSEPGLIYNRNANKDYALMLGVPGKQVEQFLDDHYDKKTGKYNLIKDPYEEKLITAKNLANNVKQLFPRMTDEMAIMASQSPSVLVELMSNEAKYWNVKAMHEPDPKKKADYQFKADVALSTQTQIMQRPEFRNYLMILDQRNDPEKWAEISKDPARLAQWQGDFLAAHREAWGPDPERDPERLFKKDMEQNIRMKGEMLRNKLVSKEIAAAEAKAGPQVDNVRMRALKLSYPNASHKNITDQHRSELYDRQDMTIGMMTQNQIPAAPKDLKKEPPANRTLRQDADNIRAAVWEYVPTETKKLLGNYIDYAEATLLMDEIYTAQINGYTPNIPDIKNKILQMRGTPKK